MALRVCAAYRAALRKVEQIRPQAKHLENPQHPLSAGRRTLVHTRYKMAGDIHLVPSFPKTVTLLEQIHKITGKFDLVFAGDAKPWKPIPENTVNTALKTIGYDTKVDICSYAFLSMACSALIESGFWSETAIERQMSDKEPNKVRAAYIHKVEFLEERRMIMTWWSRFRGANREDRVTPHGFAKQSGKNVTRIRSTK